MPLLSSNPFSIRVQPKPQPRPGVPAWVPPAGYFADVPMLNNPQDVTPSIYQGAANNSNATQSPFIMWGGSAILRDFSPLGAQVYYSGGHEASFDNPNIQLSLICDFSTLLWSCANVPMAPNIASTFLATGYTTDGTPYTPHTYLGLQEFPAAWGGGPKGTLAAFFWGGSNWSNRINLLDVSKPRMGYSQLATRQPQNVDPTKIRFAATSEGSNYPITVIDPVRQGWWVSVKGSVDYTLFVAKSGEITQYPALGGNLQNGSMALCNSLNLLVVLDGGYESGPYAGTSYRSLYIRNLATGEVTRNSTLGKVPSLQDGYDGGTANFHRPDTMGLEWVDELGCIVGLDQTASPPTVVKLTPPASNPATEPWTWSTVPLAHWPNDTTGQATLQSVMNYTWSKFRWVPSLRAFVYGTGKDRKPQVLTIS